MSQVTFGLETGVFVSLAALVFSIVSFAVNKTFGQRDRLLSLQKKMNDWQAEFNAATKAKDEKKLKEMEAREPEMMKLVQEMMWLPLKSMVFVIPLFFAALWLIERLAAGYLVTLPFSLPVPDLGHFSLNWRATFGPRGSFILWSILYGMVVESIASRLLPQSKAGSSASTTEASK